MNKNNYGGLWMGALIVALGVLVNVGCQAVSSGNTAQPQASATAPQASATPRKDFTAADIAKLKWLEGTWRGTGEKQPPFFERYSFEGTNMTVESFADETLAKVTETSLFDLKDGEFGHTEGDKRTAASEITADHVQFVPVSGVRYSYRFQKEGDGWKAVIDNPANGSKPATQVIYTMVRWKAAKGEN